MYSFDVRVGSDYDTTVDKVAEALGREGFGVLTEIDVRATLEKKLGVERRPYIILGACNPELANQALQADPDIGVLLPCNVVVREDEDGVIVTFMDPAPVMGLVDKPGVRKIADDVRQRLMRVRDALRE